jgi:hypothetical protein
MPNVDPYAQPKRTLSGGFTKEFNLTTAATTQTLITCPTTTPSDHPKKHYLRIQRLSVKVVTPSASKTWTIADSNGTPVAVTGALDMGANAGTVYSFDFGPQGLQLTLVKNLVLTISAAGAAGIVTVEGYYERDQKGAGGSPVSGAYYLTISSISPTSGPAAGGTVVRIFGTNFRRGCTVTIGGVNAPVKGIYIDDGQSAGSMDVTTGAHAAGAVDVVVTNPDTTAVTSVGAFTYV